MKKTRVMAIVLSLCILLCLGCTKKEKYVKYEYTASHESKDNILLYKSSDASLDKFMNEFFERHSRYNLNTQVHTHPVGAGSSTWKEWESMVGCWWDSSYTNNKTIPSFYATKDMVTNWLLNPKQDKQGYIWCDEGSAPMDWGMGWAFPSYRKEPSCVGYEFNDGLADWKKVASTTVGITDTLLPKDGSSELTAFAETVSEIGVESPDIAISAFHAPFVSMSMKYTSLEDAQNIDDLYVYYQNKGDKGFSEDKKAAFSKLCTTGSTITGNIPFEAYYFPMYLLSTWGKNESTEIQKIKIVLKAKPGTTISGRIQFDSIRADYDDRQANNLGTYITAAANVLSYAQNVDLIKHILPKARAAMQHYLDVLKGSTGLMSTDYYVGHDGQGVLLPGTGIGNGYWDVTSYPDVNLYTNLLYYRSVQAMLYLEKMAKTFDVLGDMPTIKGRDLLTDSKYSETVESLTALQIKVKADFEEYFWNQDKGRFIAGYYGGDRAEIQDNGYLQFNLEAVCAGLGSAEQQKSIMDWVSGVRTIKGDDSTGADIYKFEFAPRNTTKQNVGDFVWLYAGGAWGNGVHNGGAVMQSSYYDIVARSKIYGVDNAFTRLKGIQSWFDKVRLVFENSGNPDSKEFYREYYKKVKIGMQGGDSSGPVGLDYEFLEAALMYASIPTAFFGIQPESNKSLTIMPNLPSGLDYWKLENLTFSGKYYDVSIGKYFTEISGIRNTDGSFTNIDGYLLNISMRKPAFKFDVQVNGNHVDYQINNGRIELKVPFANAKIEIVGKK